MELDLCSACFLEDLEDQIDAGEQLEDLEDQVDAGAGDPHELEDQVDTGLTARREDVEREPDFIQHGGKIYVDAGYRDRLELEHQVDAGEQLEDLEHQVDASDVSEMNRWQRFVILLLMAGEIAVRQLEELETDAPCRKDEDS